MDVFHARLLERAATVDELLSDAFETRPEEEGDGDLATRRLAAWCQSAANGDQVLFSRRLARDRLSVEDVRRRFAAARRNPAAPTPAWFADAIWIERTLQGQSNKSASLAAGVERPPCAFDHLFVALADEAEARLWSDLDARLRARFTDQALFYLRHALIGELSALCAAALYERFNKVRAEGYAQFIADMRAGGLRRLFDDKPVLLRLLATLMRQWIDATREFVTRLDADLPMIRRDIFGSAAAASRVSGIEGELSDPHNGGRAVKILNFEDGARVVYKPKDLRLDAAWHALVERLNGASPPVTLKAARALPRDGYGWAEFIEHSGCAGEEGGGRYFYRAGAWLALFHCFVASDMHQENIIAAGEHPVPIDLETILQASADEHKAQTAEGAAFDAAMEVIGNSVMTVGLLPAYGRGAFNDVFAMGGLTADWGSRTVVRWENINSDAMRPAKAKEIGDKNPNLPHVGGRYARLSDHIESFVAGFADYAKFLGRLRDEAKPETLFKDFAGLPVRKVIHPTRFYYMLLQRLKNHRTMDDGAVWSAQADFVARLSNWEKDADPLWPLLRAERDALLALNVPHFVTPSDGSEVRDAAGIAARTQSVSGLERAGERFKHFDQGEIAWQIEVTRANTNSAAPAKTALAAETAPPIVPASPANDMFVAEADRIAAELTRYAIRRGDAAAWIGLDWLGDADVFQLVCLGPDLYNGAPGIALFLAAHAEATGYGPSGELALAAVAHLRNTLRDRNAARLARALGVGAATGLGSVVYALAVIAKCLNRPDLLADAHSATKLFTDELIAADRQLDVVGGSAGGILALLRLYRDTQSADVLARAARCGEHLLAQSRLGEEGRRSWIGQGFGQRALNGMSHGAAGFGYALASLAAATGRNEFARAAAECIAFEDASYDDERHNWPDLRGSGEPRWPCQWCHGAPGIGLARLAMVKRTAAGAAMKKETLTGDVRNALAGVEHGRLTPVDTLCCGSLGCVEFFCEAAAADDPAAAVRLRELASQRLLAVLQRAQTAGDYRWNNGERRFNLGLFRGLAGVGYTLLRQAFAQDDRVSLPNVLIWE